MTTLNTMYDPASAEGAFAFAHMMMHLIQKNIERDGFIQPAAFLLGCKRPAQMHVTVGNFAVTEAGPGVLCISPKRMETDEDKSRFTYLIRIFARASGAVGVFLSSEAWEVIVSTGEAAAIAGKLDEHPNRQESVVVLLEHRATSERQYLWRAVIVRDGEQVSLKNFEECLTP